MSLTVRCQFDPSPERREYVFRSNYDLKLVEILKSFPGAYWDAPRSVWRVPEDLFPVVVDKLARYEFPLVWHETSEPMEVPLRLAPGMTATLPRPDHPVLAALRPYQREAVEFVLAKSEAWRAVHQRPYKWRDSRPDGAILWLAMGTGKTLTAIATATQLPGPYLVIVPGVARSVWAGVCRRGVWQGGEIRKWLGPDADVRVLTQLDPYLARRVAIAARQLAEGDIGAEGWVNHALVRTKVGVATDDFAVAVRDCLEAGVLEQRVVGKRFQYRLVPGVPGETITSRITPAPVRNLTADSWLVISYELLDHRRDRSETFEDAAGKEHRRYQDAAWADVLAPLSPEVLICDEAHAIKKWASNRSSAIRSLTQRVNPVIRLGLTGTLFHNRPEDMYTPLAWAAPPHGTRPAAFGSRWAFLKRYADAYEQRFGWNTKGVLHPEELRARLAFHALRRTKDEVMAHLPPKIRQVLPVEGSKAKDAVDKAIAAAGDHPTRGQVRAAIALGATAKIPVAISLVLGTDERSCVFVHQRNVADETEVALRKVMQHEHRSVFLATGDQPISQREAVYEQFRQSEAGVLVATLDVVGVGIDLSAASTAVFLDLDYVPGKLLQVEDRLHRQGQRNPVSIYYLAIEASTDEAIAMMLLEKLDQYDRIAGLDKDAAGLRSDLEREDEALDGLVARLAERRED